MFQIHRLLWNMWKFPIQANYIGQADVSRITDWDNKIHNRYDMKEYNLQSFESIFLIKLTMSYTLHIMPFNFVKYIKKIKHFLHQTWVKIGLAVLQLLFDMNVLMIIETYMMFVNNKSTSSLHESKWIDQNLSWTLVPIFNMIKYKFRTKITVTEVY